MWRYINTFYLQPKVSTYLVSLGYKSHGALVVNHFTNQKFKLVSYNEVDTYTDLFY